MSDGALSEADIREILSPDEYAKAIATVKEPGDQGSAEWLAERVGYCSGSRFEDVIAKLKSGKPAKAREDYVWELVAERLTGTPAGHYVNAEMVWGSEQEPYGRMLYESRTGAMVVQRGFTRHPTIAMCGGSVDGTIGDDGIIEIKAPKTETHLKTILAQSCEEHYAQIFGYLWITGRQFCDFVSFDPRMPDHLQLYVQRVERDKQFIAMLEEEVIAFLAEVDVLVKRLAAV